jgi:TonB-dependent SusC/RagA subfamily outer membrane receptor
LLRGSNDLVLSAHPAAAWSQGTPRRRLQVGSTLDRELAPYDIESIKALKDPADTALYGIRGANGVIVITTKSALRRKNPS